MLNVVWLFVVAIVCGLSLNTLNGWMNFEMWYENKIGESFLLLHFFGKYSMPWKRINLPQQKSFTVNIAKTMALMLVHLFLLEISIGFNHSSVSISLISPHVTIVLFFIHSFVLSFIHSFIYLTIKTLDNILFDVYFLLTFSEDNILLFGSLIVVVFVFIKMLLSFFYYPHWI